MNWTFSIAIFGFTIILGTNWFKTDVQSTPFGNSSWFLILLVGSMCLGFLSFGLLVLTIIIKIILERKVLVFKKSLIGIFAFFFKPKSFKLLIGRLVAVTAIALTFLPVWIGGYMIAGSLVVSQLGYVSEDLNIVGTGSMYPTWPKGTKGKDPKELTKEVVSTAGFLPYPNGLTIGGRTIFGHTLGRGDIITWENDATRTLTSQDGTEPAGLLKRLIGLPGDTIELRDGVVYLNGEPQKEPYIAKPHSSFGEKFLKECQVITVPEGEVFAMGDNRKGSADSREIGFAPIKDIDYVLPLFKQKGILDKNWRDTSKDLDESSKARVDKAKYLELLNEKRKEAGVKPLKYQTKLEQSASKRGEVIFKYDDFSFEATKSGYPMERAMSDVGYSNIVYGEAPVQGYYESEELLENQFEFPDSKKFYLEKDYQEIGIAEVEGVLNGCPSQVIVLHFAGYIPATYDKDTVESWRSSVNNLNSIIPSWENAKGKGWMNEKELNRLLNLLYQERTIASRILAKMDERQWLTKEDDSLINDYNRMSQESTNLANELNKQ